MAKELTASQTPGEGKNFVENLDFFGSGRRVTKSAEVFGKNLAEIGKDLKDGISLQLFTKQTSLKLFTGIVKNNPVDTGYSRANWTIDETPTMSEPIVKVDGKQYERSLRKDQKIGNSFIYFIKNPLPYISALEAGWSKQAPTGFIANAVFFVAKQLRSRK